MEYKEAKAIYDRINGVERIPSDIMQIIVEHQQEKTEPISPGVTFEFFKIFIFSKLIVVICSR